MARGYSSSEIKIGWMHYYFIWYTWKAKPILREQVGWRCRELVERQVRLMNCEIKEVVEVKENNVYLAVRANPLISPHGIISKIKSFTSNTLRQEFPEIRKSPSLWNRSYFVSTYGKAAKREMREYDRFMVYRQKKHKKYVRKMNKEAREKELKVLIPLLNNGNKGGFV